MRAYKVTELATPLLFNTTFLTRLVLEPGFRGAMPYPSIADYLLFIEAAMYLGHDEYCKEYGFTNRLQRELMSANVQNMKRSDAVYIENSFADFFLNTEMDYEELQESLIEQAGSLSQDIINNVAATFYELLNNKR